MRKHTSFLNLFLPTCFAAATLCVVACSSSQTSTTANPAQPDPSRESSEEGPATNEGGVSKDAGRDATPKPNENDAQTPPDSGPDPEPPLTGPIAGPEVNGCTQYEVGSTSITWTGSATFPLCIAIRKGTAIEWNGNFEVHPLEQLPVTAGSPITIVETGTSKSFTFSNEGAFGFHCAVHAKMKGAILVVP